jgi:lipid A ethanolaminephosphotransferase
MRARRNGGLMLTNTPPLKPSPSSFLEASVTQLLLLAALFWTLSANRGFFTAALKGRDLADGSAWTFAAALLLGVFSLHVLLLALVTHRRWVKPVLAVMTVVTALASYYTSTFGIYLDPSMLRNVVHTNPAEARELLSAPLGLHLLIYAGLPLLLLWHVRVRPFRPGWLRATGLRLGLLLAAVVVLVASVLAVFQPFASLMRNQKEVRYLITPANLVWSLGAVAAADARGAARPREPIGLDVAPGPSWAMPTKPRVVVLVVGETARAANWGLYAGSTKYARQTTPELAALMKTEAGALVNFSQVRSCGTNTETSLPCMFAPVGRRGYDESRIRGQQSLLHVAARAGVAVHWRDNQSGCKGVCDGLPGDTVMPQNAPGLCRDGPCLDEGLMADLDARLKALNSGEPKTTQLWVLHMLGNHGPAYHRRAPPAFARFQPACTSDDLRQCSTVQIVNAYDNALLYTDHVLASTIATLKAHAADVDSALIYVSDHGESLGEHGLFLHGIPYAIAPDVQTQVPMIAWQSPGLARAVGMPEGCLQTTWQQQADQPLAHDHLFHTVLGLLDLKTALYEAPFDLSASCRASAVAMR